MDKVTGEVHKAFVPEVGQDAPVAGRDGAVPAGTTAHRNLGLQVDPEGHRIRLDLVGERDPAG